MPKKVLNEIKYACQKIPNVEWSGVLFYSIKGSIKDPKNLELVLEGILPMQKGVTSYTEYSFDERVVEYMTNGDERMTWKMGHVHSHNNMGVFFSGTDMSELHDNAPNHNFYLSLIVNNKMDFTAKIAFIADFQNATMVAKDENGEEYKMGSGEVSKKLIIYDCDIVLPEDNITVTEEFSNGIDHIIEKAKKNTRIFYSGNNVYNDWLTKNKKKGKKNKKRVTPRLGFAYESKQKPAPIIVTPLIDDYPTDDDINDFNQYDDIIEDFTKYILNNGNNASEFEEFHHIIEDLYLTYGVTPSGLASSIIGKYVEMYDKYFSAVKSKNTPETFIKITDSLIEELDIAEKMTIDKEVESYFSTVKEALIKLNTEFQKDGFDKV